MPAYVVVNLQVMDPVRYEEYKKMAPASIAAYGGRYLARGGAMSVLEGAWETCRFVILEFSDAARARAWWDSKEYAPAKALRQATAQTDLVIVEGC